MKKTLAILLALILALVNVAALAEDTEEAIDTSTWVSDEVTFTGKGSFIKTYEGSTILPTETLAFVSTPDEGNPDTTNLTIDGYAATAATGYLTVTVPSYSKVGIYKYTIAETAGTSQGVEYSTESVGLTVLVTYNYDEQKLDTQVGITKNDEGKKEDTFTNTYTMNDLTVSKTVAGNMGDQSQLFDITVTLTSETGKTVNSAITITGSSDTASNQTVAGGWTGEKVLNLKIKHGDTIKLANIPTGVSYAVAENEEKHGADDPNYSDGSKGYDITYSGEEGKIAAEGTFEATITNTKNVEIDTGVTVESVPYIMILAVVMIGAALLVLRKREEY